MVTSRAIVVICSTNGGAITYVNGKMSCQCAVTPKQFIDSATEARQNGRPSGPPELTFGSQRTGFDTRISGHSASLRPPFFVGSAPVLVRIVQFLPGSLDLASVRRLGFRIFSFWQAEEERRQRQQFHALAFAGLFPERELLEPVRPVWKYPEFAMFFVNVGAQSDDQTRCFRVLHRVLGQTEFGNLMVPDHAALANAAVGAFNRSLPLWERRPRSDGHFPNYCTVVLSPAISRLSLGEHLIIPFGFNNSASVIVLQRNTVTDWSFSMICTHAEGLLQYHASSAASPPKIKYKTALVIDQVPLKKVVDEVFWAALFLAATSHPDKVYDVLLPLLKDRPLDSLLLDAESAENVDWRTPDNLANILRPLSEAFHHIVRRKGASRQVAKHTTFLVRERLMEYIANDVLGQTALEKSDRRLINIVCEEVAHAAAKLGGSGQLTAERLRAVKQKIDDLRDRMAGLPMQDANTSVNPPPLHLEDKGERPHSFSQHGLFDRLHRDEDVDGFAGNVAPRQSYVPVDLLRMPTRCDTFDDVLRALRYCDHQCLLLNQQATFVVNRDHLILSLITHTFTEVVPMPRPCDDKRADLCFWGQQKMRGERQLDLLMILRRLMQQFAVSGLTARKDCPQDAAVFSTVPLCISAVADAVMRKIATDIPSRVSCHLLGQTIDGESTGPGYAFRPLAYRRQITNLLVAHPEWNVARTAALDYFYAQTTQRQMFQWGGQRGCVICRNTARFMLECFGAMAFPNPVAGVNMLDGWVPAECPEFLCYRDIAFFAFWFQQPADQLHSIRGQAHGVNRESMRLAWSVSGDNQYSVAFMGTNMSTVNSDASVRCGAQSAPSKYVRKPRQCDQPRSLFPLPCGPALPERVGTILFPFSPLPVPSPSIPAQP